MFGYVVLQLRKTRTFWTAVILVMDRTCGDDMVDESAKWKQQPVSKRNKCYKFIHFIVPMVKLFESEETDPI